MFPNLPTNDIEIKKKSKKEKAGNPQPAFLNPNTKTFYEKEIDDINFLEQYLIDNPDGKHVERVRNFLPIKRNWLQGGYKKYLGVPKVVHADDFPTIYIGPEAIGFEESVWAADFFDPWDITPEDYQEYLYGNKKLLLMVPDLKSERLGCWGWRRDTRCYGHVIAELYELWAIENWKKFGYSGFQNGSGIFKNTDRNLILKIVNKITD